MESLLLSDPPITQESWIQMIGCYKDAVDLPPPPTRVAISTMTAERVKLYQNVPPPGHPIPVGVQPVPVDDSIPEDE